ncbi:uncharacterized protein LOC129598805 [Paramacrobiotus metropolitanus]|uniref:uncharacterized protein LOC129598805 n=1 Tax=Paramacrobiotus metropolitanus TaxID=2943436 RepID=UPI0024459213|nr:uncharacterized protein LOC129598805 [Paramacrobiotus metropolitanus]
MEMKVAKLPMGRRSFTAGDVVMCCEPVVWVLESGAYKTRCAYCLRQSQNLVTCARCNLHRYCSVACQTADLELEHNLECTLLQQATGMETAPTPPDSSAEYSFDVPQELIAKLANKIKLNQMVDVPGMGQKSVKDLLSILPTNPDQAEIERSLLPKISAGESKHSMLIDLPAADVLTYFGILRYNVLSLFDGLFSPNPRIGLALYPHGPHSMTPVCWDINVVVNYQARRTVMHAVEDIPQYTGPSDLRHTTILKVFCLTRAERRAAFEHHHGYPCTCRRCTPEYDAEINPLRCVMKGCSNRIPSDSRAQQACSDCGAINSDRLQKFREFSEQHEKIRTSYPEKRRAAMVLQLCREIDAAGILQPDAHFRYVCGWELPQKYFDENRYEEGWKMIAEMIVCVRKIYPKYAVFRARELNLAGWSAIDALEKRMQNIGPVPMSRSAILEVCELVKNYCGEAKDILAKLFGTQCYGAQKFLATCGHVYMKAFRIQQALYSRK